MDEDFSGACYIVIASPLCKAAVLVSPNGVAPAMTDFSTLLHIFFIDLDTQARSIRNRHITILVAEHFRLGHIIEQVIALVVMDAQALFLDEGVVGDRIDLQAGGQRDR